MDNQSELLNKLKKLEEENEALKNKLKSYTAPSRSKTYYENHKEDIKQKVKEYKEKTNYIYEVTPEKKKEYARRYTIILFFLIRLNIGHNFSNKDLLKQFLGHCVKFTIFYRH